MGVSDSITPGPALGRAGACLTTLLVGAVCGPWGDIPAADVVWQLTFAYILVNRMTNSLEI